MTEIKYCSLLQQAYKKLKSSVFFDKTQLILRDKIVEYEVSSEFDSQFEKLSKRMESEDWEDIINSIGFISYPKSIKNQSKKGFISNWNNNITEVDKLQYFLDMNVEGYILGIVWLLVVGNKIDDKIYEHSYGNRIRKNLLDDKGQSTYSPYLFEPYFQQYENWRDTALNYAQKSLNKNQDVVILMLDFQRFFYQVDISQKELISFVNTITNDEVCQLNDEYKELAIRLTRFIWNVIERYSNTLRKECPNLIENRNVLPIGFYPSNVLSNFALSKFDDALINGWNPIYYGRYVDDIIIVEKVEKNSYIYKEAKSGKLTADEVIQHYLTNCNAWQKKDCCCKDNMNNGLLLIPEKSTDETNEEKSNSDDSKEIIYTVNPTYNQFVKSKILVQQEKVKIFYFNSAQSDALLSCFKEKLYKNKSEFRFLPEDEAVFQNDDYTEIFSLNEKDGPNKLRGVDNIAIDKFRLSKYLGKYMRVSGLIHDKLEKQFDADIEKIFTNQVTIENYLVWEKVLEILIINDKFDTYLKFVKHIMHAINKINIVDTEGNSRKLHSTLYKILASCIYRTLSLSWGKESERVQQKIEELSSDVFGVGFSELKIHHMKKSYCKTRMCDKYAMPVLIDGFLDGNNDTIFDDQSLNCTNFETIKNSNYIFDYFDDYNRDYMFYPYLITMNDLTIYGILKKLKYQNGDLNDKDIKDYKKRYLELNYCNYSDDSSINKIVKAKSINLTGKKAVAIKVESKKLDNIKIAIANTILRESDFEKVLNDCPNRTYQRYKQLTETVNEAIRCKADMLVLPEGYLPFEWLPILARTCAKNQIAIVTGIEHLKFKSNDDTTNPSINNLTAVVLPFVEDDYKFSYIHFHKKVYIAPHEKEKIESYGCKVREGEGYELYDWNNFWFSVYCCYELSSISDRSIFQSYIDALIAVEWNKDTNYYSNIVESLSRDLHCFCIQVNTSEFGDSRITRPSKTEERDILKVKGGRNSAVLIDTIDISGLREFQIKGNVLQAKSPDSKYYKQTPPTFDSNIAKQKQQCALWNEFDSKA